MNGVEQYKMPVTPEDAEDLDIGDTVNLVSNPTDMEEDKPKRPNLREFLVIEIKKQKDDEVGTKAEIKIADKQRYEKWCEG